MSGVEIVRHLPRAVVQAADGAATPRRRARSGGYGTTRFAITTPTGVAHEMLGTYMPVPDESGWGVVVQVDIEKAYFTAIDLRNKSHASSSRS